MSNKLFQSMIYQMKDTTDRMIGVVDDGGTVVACSQLSHIGEIRPDVADEIAYTFDAVALNGYTYKSIGSHTRSEFAAFAEGEDAVSKSLASIISVSLTTFKSLYDEKYDKANFVKNIVLDNILPGDIYIKAKELRFDNEINRVVYLVRFHNKGEVVPFDVVQNIFPDKSRDYVISISETDIVLVKELKTTAENRSVEAYANSIVDTASSEFFYRATVGIGSVVSNIKELARSYKDAQIALEVGKVFDTEKSVINYENLGIARLIYQLPATLCEMFLQEVFKRGSLEALDKEMLMTIQAFFENNLNVSETSRRLFCHRNTLVYRLEKIKKLTGLDLREFDHAITFKVALMVKKYIASKPSLY